MMKRLISGLLVALSLVLFTAPISAQDDGALPTIAEIVTTDERYSLLFSAVQSADPVILEVLSDAGGQLTLFAPTNQAFRNLASFFETDLETLLGDPAIVTELLLYHVAPAALTAGQVAELDGGAMETLSEARVRVNVVGGVVRLNDIVRVIAPFDRPASNGIVHTLSDMVFPFTVQDALEAMRGTASTPDAADPAPTAQTPPRVTFGSGQEAGGMGGGVDTTDGLQLTGAEIHADAPQSEIITVATFADRLTIAGRVASDSRYSTLRDLMLAVAPDYIDLLNSADVDVTLFAPTNSAFVVTLNRLGLRVDDLLAEPTIARQIIAYHLVDGALSARDIRASAGDSLNSALLLNGAETFIGVDTDTGRVRLNQSVFISTPDRGATNGVIHTIDGVLIPPAILEALAADG
ncbi:MAG: fasciclin domain-containing protein [Anaerolineaceae bacterium]|nr:MAG: fasciclin domain-containing protein [Anaerolineaceae bacterium]